MIHEMFASRIIVAGGVVASMDSCTNGTGVPDHEALRGGDALQRRPQYHCTTCPGVITIVAQS